MRYYAGHARRVRHGSAEHPLLTVGGGRMALQVGARVVVLKPNGARVAAVEAPDLQSIALSGTELGVAGRSVLGLYNPATGHLRKSIALGPNAALISFPLPSKVAERLVDAKLTAAGLFYASNVARGKKNGRVVFEPTSRLLARF